LEASEEEAEALRRICAKYEKTVPQMALNWLISKPGVVAIPKAATIEHVEENVQAVGWKPSEDDTASLENAFE
jgi:myo-inositol catabolism protein IolS